MAISLFLVGRMKKVSIHLLKYYKYLYFSKSITIFQILLYIILIYTYMRSSVQYSSINQKLNSYVQQVLISKMIKSNKIKHGLQLPKISPIYQFNIAHQDQVINHNRFSTIKTKRSDSCLKENSAPKDARTSTLYLDFPIGKKKNTVQSPCELQIEKLTQNAMFANRAICSIYRKDVRARMFKYDQERMNFMTERVNNYVTSEHQVLRQFINRQMSKKKQQRVNQRNYCLELTKHQIPNRLQPWQKVSSWDNYAPKFDEQPYDEGLQQTVKESKLLYNKRF